MSVSLVTGLNHGDAAMNALIPRVLRRGCEAASDIYQISSALDELYGARIEPFVRKKGELQCIGFFCDFPDDRYLPGDDNLLEATIGLMGSILLKPDMTGGYLRPDYVESEKSILIDDIRAAINDKSGYVIDRLLASMCTGEPFGINKLGSEADVPSITPETLTQQYKKLLSSARIEIIYCGVASPERVKKSVIAAFGAIPPRGIIDPPQTVIIDKPAFEAPRRFDEEMDVTQGKLAIGYRIGRVSNTPPDYPALMVFNSIFGSGATSKLFLNVREKLSLCYYVSSMTERHKEIMIVSSGVDEANFDTALNEIRVQLDNMKNGDFSDADLTISKRLVASGLKAAFDRAESIEGFYFDSRIAASSYDPMQLCDKVSMVTFDDIVSLSSAITIDTIYCLKGREGTLNDGA